jgi:ribosome-binding factor A
VPDKRRPHRIATLIHAEVARLLREEVEEPVLATVSLTGVTVTPDLSVARIGWLPLAGLGDRKAMQALLDSWGPRLRGPVGRHLGIRHAPELRFEVDRNVEYAAHMDDVFARLPRPAEPEGEP